MIKDLVKLLGIGTILFAAGFFLKSVGVAELSARASTSDLTHMTFTTSDGLILHAWKSEGAIDTTGSDHRPGLALLLPMMANTHDSYESLVNKLNDAHYTTLAFDLRGHGQSVVLGIDTVSATRMDKANFAKIPSDIDQFFRDFEKRYPNGYNYDDVIVIGASIGANTAGLLTDSDWVKRMVMLSPGRDYYGLQPETVMVDGEEPSDKPIYIAVSADDKYSAESSQWLFDNYSGPKVLKKYPGGAHGTAIFSQITDADQELLSWLRPEK